MSVENKVENLVCLWPVQCLKCFIVKTNDQTSYAFSLYTNSPCSNVYLIIFIWKICFFIQSTIKKIVVVFKITFKTVHVLHMKMTKESTPPHSPKCERVRMFSRITSSLWRTGYLMKHFKYFIGIAVWQHTLKKIRILKKKNQSRVDLGQFIFFGIFFSKCVIMTVHQHV